MKWNIPINSILLLLFSLLFSLNLYSQQHKNYGTVLTSQHINADTLKSISVLDVILKDSSDLKKNKIVTDQIIDMEFELIIARKGHDLVILENKSPVFSEETLYQLASVTKGSLILINKIKIKTQDAIWLPIENISLYIKE